MNPPNVAALYVERGGPYFKLLPSTRCWHAWRDARKYGGPHPIVAHPPCGPWGRLKGLCTKQDPELGRIAVGQVRRFGGVLEHPAHSGLWRDQRLPRQGEFLDPFGGWTLQVCQVDYGHRAVKETWLYIVGLSRQEFYGSQLWRDRPPPGVPTHTVTYDIASSLGQPKLVKLSAVGARRPPLDFARFLIALASSCSGP